MPNSIPNTMHGIATSVETIPKVLFFDHEIEPKITPNGPRTIGRNPADKIPHTRPAIAKPLPGVLSAGTTTTCG